MVRRPRPLQRSAFPRHSHFRSRCLPPDHPQRQLREPGRRRARASCIDTMPIQVGGHGIWIAERFLGGRKSSNFVWRASDTVPKSRPRPILVPRRAGRGVFHSTSTSRASSRRSPVRQFHRWPSWARFSASAEEVRFTLFHVVFDAPNSVVMDRKFWVGSHDQLAAIQLHSTVDPLYVLKVPPFEDARPCEAGPPAAVPQPLSAAMGLESNGDRLTLVTARADQLVHDAPRRRRDSFVRVNEPEPIIAGFRNGDVPERRRSSAPRDAAAPW